MKKESQGKYVFVVVPGHAMADKRGRVLEHRYVMSEHLGRPLLRTELVHHKDEVKTHNEIGNLELIGRGEHTKLHQPADILKLICPKCLVLFERARRNAKGLLVFCSRKCACSYYRHGSGRS